MAEFTMVAALLTALTLGVVQFGIAVYVRNVVHDAAVEGAYYGALADVDPGAAAARTSDLIARAVGPDYARDVEAALVAEGVNGTVRVTVRTAVPVVGLWSGPIAMEVVGDAPREYLG
ncbi:hypothetical protein GCM10009808_04680 [Microbacterium sediminicola]|uniref:TadE-like domain-containing protein n=1 Tax=Microbacterium sediminicola TaxID=415210 RepID=A0ABN2HNI0_9MICO